jgi:hypothetical protein
MDETANQADSKGPPVLPAFYNAKTIRSGNQMKTNAGSITDTCGGSIQNCHLPARRSEY